MIPQMDFSVTYPSLYSPPYLSLPSPSVILHSSLAIPPSLHNYIFYLPYLENSFPSTWYLNLNLCYYTDSSLPIKSSQANIHI